LHAQPFEPNIIGMHKLNSAQKNNQGARYLIRKKDEKITTQTIKIKNRTAINSLLCLSFKACIIG